MPENLEPSQTVDPTAPKVLISSTAGSRRESGNTHTGMMAAGFGFFVHLVMDFIESIVVALSIFVVIYLFIMQPHEVKGSSMEPSFSNNEYILTDKISYRLHGPSRGDVVIFKSPVNPDQDYIKRVIGLPGERVKVQGGHVYINGNQLKESYLNDLTALSPGSMMREGQELTVPTGQVLVLGDNRFHSSDSREFGPIRQDSIIGKAVVRYWPVNQLGLIPVPLYQ